MFFKKKPETYEFNGSALAYQARKGLNTISVIHNGTAKARHHEQLARLIQDGYTISVAETNCPASSKSIFHF